MHRMNNGTGSVRDKIKDIDELATIVDLARSNGQKIVHCHGVFDLLHIGHMRHFEEAKKLGDVLVVTTTPDNYVNKGPGRPVFSQDLRAEAIAALDCVDHVAINRWPMAVETIRMLRPDFYVKGPDYQEADKDRTGGISEEKAAIKSVGGQLVITDDITFSASNLINRHLQVFPKEVSDYLTDFSSKYSSDDVLRYLEAAHSLKVLVIGETIIDEYQYCQQMGMSTKEPVLAVRYLSTEKFAGGVLAVANNIANFCDNVSVMTFLGQEDSQEDLIRSNLRSNVEPIFLYQKDSPTIIKRRMVENYLLRKLFEVYVMGEQDLAEEEEQELCGRLNEVLSRFDLVVVADYGHGMMTKDVIKLLCDRATFLAVNTQANAGNRGFNTISRYPRADFVSLTHYELSLEERNRQIDVKDQILSVSRKLDCRRVLITQGKIGNICYTDSEGFVKSPAFGSKVVDTMGAGDAVFSLTSLCMVQGAPADIVGFIGNAVGAEAVATLGHQSSIENLPLFRHIETLMK